MKLKKLIAIALSVLTMGTCVASVGCSNPGGPSGPAGGGDKTKTVNLMMSGGGYGTAYMEDLIDKFEAIYAEEGYKINLLPTSSSFGTTAALAEMRLGIDCGYDIVMPGSVYAYDALDPVYGDCVECLDDVYSAKPIGFDGKEEDKTLLEKLRCDEFNYWVAQDINDVVDGTWYGYFKVDSSRGVVCNTSVLANYAGVTNFEEQYPRTSEEFFAYFNKIASNEEAQEQYIMPLVYAGDKENGAATYSCSSVWMATGQILGKEQYNKLNTMEEEYAANGNQWYSDDWKYAFENEALVPTMEYTIQSWDNLYAINGAEQMQLNRAHGNLMLGLGAFMFDGNYFYNEVRENYEAYIDDVRMIPYPVVSYVGLKYELCGADHNVGVGNNSGKKCADCDKIMSAIIKGCDDRKDPATIKTEVQNAFSITLTDEQVAGIIEARQCQYGIMEPSYIIKGSPKADIAKLFLRMCASDDAAEVYEKYGMMSAYVAPDADENTPQFVADCYKLNSLRTWGVDVHSKPGVPKVFNWCPTYSATVGVSIHADLPKDKNWKDRDYARIVRELTSEGGKMYDTAKSMWKNSVRTRGLNYNEGTNPNR